MINITDKSKGCGCQACGDACAKGAISFATDEEVFLDLDRLMGKGSDPLPVKGGITGKGSDPLPVMI